ncbi:ribosomal RNA small subunit methyltransferase A [candidate division GN15 bacterium]|nr:ribosomal RNA small subunit methyltransferase A [candidate division GN15 bacterium]
MGGYRVKKRLGQHFLSSTDVLDRLIGVIAPQPDEAIVEVGPGQGVLTTGLADKGARVTAVEFDRDLIPALEKRFAAYPHVTIINADFLNWRPESERFALVGNLPYNLTSPVIEWCLEHRESIDRAIFMVQKELAERLAASPDSKAWSPLSIFTQLHFDPAIAFDVSPIAFEPPPGVTSSVITLYPHEAPAIEHEGIFRSVVRAAFAQRRKQLTNNLSRAFHVRAETVREVLEEMSLPATVRAEQVTIEQFLALTKHLRARTIV